MGDVKILVVEDDSIEALDIKRTLESFGYSVPCVASKGEEAIRKAYDIMPDLVLIDIVLKGDINGIEVAQEIKKLEIPIIYLTAHSEESTVKKAMSTGPYGYIIKPYSSIELKYGIELAIYKNNSEKKLKASESKYVSLFENMLNGFAYHQIVVDGENQPVDYVFLRVNKAFERVTGLKREDIIGKRVREVIPDIVNANPELIGLYGRVALTGESEVFELYFKPFDKFYSVTAYSEEKGYFAAVFEDISQRKLVEKALKESEKRYRTIVENVQDAYLRGDKKGFIVMASPSAARMYRFNSSHEMKGIPSISLYKSPSDRQLLLDKLESDTKVENLEIEALRKDGTSFWASMNAQYYFGENGEISGTEAFIRDITQTRKVKKALEKSESYYRTIFEHTGTATVILEQDTTISLANEEFEKLSGYSREELEGKKSWTEFVIGEDLERMEKYHRLRRIEPQKAPEIYDFKFIDRDGVLKYIHLEVGLVPGTKKSVASLLDITGRKKAEERINRLYRLYATLSQVNQSVVRIKDTEELFARICQVCVEYGKFKMAWMGIIDRETGKLTPVNHYGNEDGYLEKISIDLHEKPGKDKPASTVKETGELVVIEDITNEPNIKWAKKALKKGYNSLALIPVKSRGDLIGILNIYSSEAGFFSDKEEVELVKEMGMDISMAIDSMETEKDRQKMVKALHESENQLKFSNEWLAFAQKAAKSGFWDWDMLTEKITWSPEFYELFGLPSTAEPSFDTWLEIMHPDDRDPAMYKINHAIENHEFLENEYRIIRPDGIEIWISALGTTYYDREGNPVRMSGICLDITEPKKKESEIQFKTTLMEAQLESSPDGILVVDNNGKTILYNHRFVEMWNIPPKILKTKDDQRVIDSVLKQLKDPYAFKEKVKYLYSHESEKSMDEIKLNDGKVFERYSTPLYGSKNSCVGRIWYFQDITGKMKIQNQIKNQYHFLQHLMDTIPYPLFYKDKNYTYIGCNAAFEDFIGLSKDSIVGKTVYDISPEDLADKYHQKDKELMEGKDLQVYEAPVKYADGSKHIVLFNKTTFDDGEGNVAGLIGLMVDITQRKEAENALKVSENKYRALFDNAEDGIFLMRDDRFIECNQKALEMYGVTRDQIIGEKPHVFSPELQPDGSTSKDKSLELVKKALEGHPQHFEWKHLRYDGTTFYTEVTLNQLKIGDEYLIQAIVRDVTSRKNTEDLLMESEHRHRILGQLISDFAYSCVHGESGEYEVDWITDSFYNITGFTEKELDVQRCWMFTVHPEDETIAHQQLLDLKAGSTNVTIFRIITSNGEVRWLRNHVRCVEDTEPGRLRIYGAAQDITQERKYLDDLKWELEINHSLSRVYAPMISEESSLEDIAELILEESEKLTGSQKGYAATIDLVNQDMVVHTHTKMIEEGHVKLNDKIRFPRGEDGSYPTFWGHSLNNLTGFYTNSPQTPHSVRGLPEGHTPLENFISVPVVAEDELLGQISLANSTRDYNDLDLEALERISVYYALAIQRIRYKEKNLATLNEKELLLREIHHRVKNNMQIVTSLMNLQKQYVEEAETKKVLGESQARVKSMAMVHEKLYESSDLSHINFEEYVEKLVYGIFYSYQVPRDTIKPIINIENVAMSMETSIPLGLIINELVSNSLRYAFPNKRKGEIKISIKRAGDEYELIVSDNGIGFPDEMDLENLKSLGLQLVSNLALQLDGEITLDRSHGTEFRVKFKEFEYKERI